jgi:leukotriene-A4 hydrolase
MPSLSSVKPASKQKADENETLRFEKVLNETLQDHQKNSEISWIMESIGYIDDVLTEEECQYFCSLISNSSYLTFWSEKGRNNDDCRSFRDANTIEINSSILSNMIWSRIHHYFTLNQIQKSFPNEDDGTEDWRVDLSGYWNPHCINPDLLFACYPSDGYFSPHTDGNVILNFNIRSFYSVIIFLNTIPDNGGTKFYKDVAVTKLFQTSPGSAWKADDRLCVCEVKAVVGRLLLFDQKYVHEGVPPGENNLKFIIRTDIMFIRNPCLLTSPQDVEAYALHQKAEYLSETGEIEESIKLFRQAYRMSPDLARIMRQG